MEFDMIVVGDCLEILPTIPDRSVDAVITDPPYPHIKRDYGRWTTEEWWELIVEGVIPEVRRILKPSGSAVFILQPNSEKVGKIRGWLWEFMAWVCREWNMIQDAWWWNYTALPCGGATTGGLMRGSIKALVWCGSSSCYRNQEAVLWSEAEASKLRRLSNRANRILGERQYRPSGHSSHTIRIREAAAERGGVTPFNLLPAQHDGFRKKKGHELHGAVTPLAVVDWWIRYIVPPDGLTFDPFMGTGTTAVAALKLGRHFYGCDISPEYVELANKRVEKARLEMAQMEFDL